MKKISLLLAVLFLGASSVKAQTQLEKGNLLLGITSTVALNGTISSEFMSLGLITIKYKYGSDPAEAAYKMTNFNILPKAGYFVTENLAAGLQAIAAVHRQRNVDNDDTFSENALGIGPFVRYYYPLDNLYPFIEAESVFGTRKESWYENEHKIPFIMFGISLGAALPLGDNVTFDAAAGYLHASYKDSNNETEETVNYITGGFALRMGFTIYL